MKRTEVREKAAVLLLALYEELTREDARRVLTEAVRQIGLLKPTKVKNEDRPAS